MRAWAKKLKEVHAIVAEDTGYVQKQWEEPFITVYKAAINVLNCFPLEPVRRPFDWSTFGMGPGSGSGNGRGHKRRRGYGGGKRYY